MNEKSQGVTTPKNQPQKTKTTPKANPKPKPKVSSKAKSTTQASPKANALQKSKPQPKATTSKKSKSLKPDCSHLFDETNLQHFKVFFSTLIIVILAIVFKDKITNVNELLVFLVGVFVGKK